jgi:hypothetical protein
MGAALLALPVNGEDLFPDVEYVSGKSGFNEKIKGSLVVSDSAVAFRDKKGQSVFSIPALEVVGASQSRERDEGSFGRKMALGIFASKTEEFLRVETKSASGAEVIVFKTKKERSPGMAAKINFIRDAAKPEAPKPEAPKEQAPTP